MEYWESQFKNEGTRWGFEPSDSAIFSLDLFNSHRIKNILIPGFGYGRNAKLFYDAGFKITGIEISETAIELARQAGLDCKIHHGSVTSMPFDKEIYDGIFCYALIHLLNQFDRRVFLNACFSQLKSGGMLVFSIVSKQTELYGSGKRISKDRFKLKNGLSVFFYDLDSAKKEFHDFGIIDIREIDEPVKFMTGQQALKFILVICRKN